MASPILSEDALAIRTRLRDGRKDEALRMLYDKLQAGEADSHVQRLASDFIMDIIEPFKGRRGRPRQIGPQRWVDIGECYAKERARGLDHTNALRETQADFMFSKEHVRKAVKFFQLMRGEVTT